MKAILPALLVAIVSALPVSAAATSKPWIGHQFQSEQCVPIREGQITFKRKLCRIDYRINPKDGGYHIEGYLTFNPRFVPRLPKSVDLEILLMDTRFVCTEQINLHRAVDKPSLYFAIAVPPTALARYIRTYYTLHYE